MLIVGFALATAPGTSGVWLGQDGQDHVGPSSEVKPSDVQDIHIALEGLHPGRAVAHVIVTGEGADEWQYQGKWGPWAAKLVRKPGSPQGDLFLEPTRLETGRPFRVKIRYEDGNTSDFVVRGGRATPYLRMPGAAL